MANELSQANINSLDVENEPAPTISLSEAPAPNNTPDDKLADNDDTIASYDGIKWDRLPDLTKPHHDSMWKVSWIYKYGYCCQSTKIPGQIIFICKYCHIHKIIDSRGEGRYDITRATTAASAHLKKLTPGHGYDSSGKITPILQKNQLTLLEQLQVEGYKLPQSAVNTLVSSFNTYTFWQAAINWLKENNHLLRKFKMPSFHQMMRLVNPEAE